MKKTILWMMLLSPCLLSIGAFADTYKGKSDYYGKRHGIWKQYHGDTNILSIISTYHHGVLNGSRQYFYKSKKKYATEVFKDGKQTGPFTIWYDNKKNTVKSKGTFLEGKYSGKKTDWHENKEIKSTVNYIRGSLEGKAEYFYSSKNVWYTTFYKNGRHHGLYVEKFDNTANNKKQEGKHVHGKRHGKWMEWHGNGKVKSIEELAYTILEGEAKYFYPSGKKKVETNYRKGKHQGLYVEYYDNVDNNEKRKGNHINGHVDGKWTEWHINGVVSKTSFYKNVQRNGEWKEFDDTGKLLKTTTYKNGDPVKGGTKKK